MKTEQLQIRVSAQMKAAIRNGANAAKMDMSEWILTRLFPERANEFQRLVETLAESSPNDRFYAFASINEFLSKLNGFELLEAVSKPPSEYVLNDFAFNYLAAMVELACNEKKIHAPKWTNHATGLDSPYFGSQLMSVRLHLLTAAPPPFRKRNIFIDSSIGDRV
jgi:hypothetical protein